MASKSKPDGAALERVESFQWPKGHIGHLADPQRTELEAFKDLCAEKGYYTPADPSKNVLASHDDETMLRYLRARKFVPQDAFVQFKDTEDWRKENEIDNLYETIDIDEYDSTRKLYPQWTGRRDKRGIPVYVFEVGSLNYKDITANNSEKNRPKSASKVPWRLMRLFALYENLLRFALPMSSAIPRPHNETPISQSSNIVDISNVGLTTFWNLKNHMQDASKLATAHYPETLDRIFILGAPSFFPTVWGWIKKWFDPITVSKIFILSKAETLPTLETFLEKDDIPKKYGGNLDWSFGELPSLEPAIAKAIDWSVDLKNRTGDRTLPAGPLRWEYDDSGNLVLVAVGSEKGVQRHQKLGTLSPSSDVTILDIGVSRASGKNAPNGTSSSSKPEDVIAGGTADIPYHHTSNRTGTSDTRLEQQAGTHAEDQVAHGTPEVVTDGQGTTHNIIEPRTVGQSAKETPLVDDTPPAKGVVDQAKEVVGQVSHLASDGAATVLKAVGLASAGEAVEEKSEEKKGPHPADDLKDAQVEEYIRATTASKKELEKEKEKKTEA